jgi:hypothetical protein
MVPYCAEASPSRGWLLQLSTVRKTASTGCGWGRGKVMPACQLLGTSRQAMRLRHWKDFHTLWGPFQAITRFPACVQVTRGYQRAKGLAGFGTALNCATTRWLVCAQQVRDELEQQLIAAVVAAKTEEVLAATVLAAGVSPAEAALQPTGTDATHIQEDEAAEQVDRTELYQRADAYCPGMARRK